MQNRIAMMEALAVLALAAGQVRADVAFSDFGPGDTFNSGVGWTVAGSGSSIGTLQTDAMQFTSVASGNLTTVELAVGFVGGSNSFTVTLLTDSAGAPGMALESLALMNVPDNNPSSYTPATVTSVSHPAFIAGTKYWLEISPSDPTSDTEGSWSFNSIGATGLFTQSGQAPGTNTLSTFAVNVAAVPEPSGLVLGLMGLAGVLGFGAGRRRRVAA
jgi:MYXO-CTERM domain-containing protein